MKAHKTIGVTGSLCKGNGLSQGQTHLYMALGMVNICTVKAREFNPFSFPLPASFCSQHLSTQENRTIKHTKNKAVLSSACVCCPLAIAVSQLVLCFSWQERRTTQKSFSQKTSKQRVFSEHAYLFSDSSLHSLNRTS